jgi:hypothetical protein
LQGRVESGKVGGVLAPFGGESIVCVKETYLSELLGGVGEEGADVILHQVLCHTGTERGKVRRDK